MKDKSAYKKNHFVPKTYLRRFTDPSKWDEKHNFIYSLNLNDFTIRNSTTKDQCQKSNFYKLPDKFDLEEKKTIEKAFMGHIDSIYSKAMDKSFDQGKEPTVGDINSIVWFIIYQSFRTPKFKKEHLAKVRELGLRIGNPNSELEEYTYWLGYLLVKAGFKVFKSSLIEILISRKGNWFITSDNPASFWLQTWNNSEYLGTLLGNNEKPNLKLLCPINPQIAIVLHINILKNTFSTNSADKMNFFRRTIEEGELGYINRKIVQAADKLIFSIEKEQLEKIKTEISA